VTSFPAPSRIRVWPALFASLAIQVLVSMSGLTGAVLAPLAAEDFGFSAVYIGLYVSTIYGIAACSSLMSGGAIARFGPLRTSQACLVLAAVALAFAATGHPAALLVNAILMGLSFGPPTPASTTMLAQGAPPQWMNLLFSIRQTGVPIGNMLAGAILPGLALAVGWQMSALLVAAACLALVFIVQPVRNSVDASRDRGRRVFAGGIVLGPLRLVFGNPALRRIALVSFAFSGMQSALGAFLVVYLHHNVGMPLVLAGIVLSAAQIAGAGGRILWGIVADRLATPRVVLGALGVTMTAAALTTGLFTPDWPVPAVFAVCIVFGGTAVAWNGVYLAQIAKLSPPGRAGEATGGTSFVTFSGVVFAPVLVSIVVSTTGSYTLAFALIAVLTGIAGVSFFLPQRGRSAGA
jgi:MFS family permease